MEEKIYAWNEEQEEIIFDLINGICESALKAVSIAKKTGNQEMMSLAKSLEGTANNGLKKIVPDYPPVFKKPVELMSNEDIVWEQLCLKKKSN